MKTCPTCQHLNEDDAVFCAECGTFLASVAPSSAAKKKPVSNVLVIVLLIIFFPVGLYLMWARTSWSKGAKIAVTVAVALIFIAGLPGSPSDASDSDITTDAPSTNAPETDAVTTSAEDAAKAQIESAISAGSFGKKADVTYVFDSLDNYAIISIDYLEITTVQGAVISMLDSIAKMLEPLSAVDGLKVRVAAFFPTVDVYGKTGKDKVILFEFTPETLKKIEWKNFDCLNLAIVADEAFVSNNIKEYIRTK